MSREHDVSGAPQAADAALEGCRAAGRALARQRAALGAEAAAAEERGAAARRRIPDLEAGKHAAAAARVRGPARAAPAGP